MVTIPGVPKYKASFFFFNFPTTFYEVGLRADIINNHGVKQDLV